MNEITKKRLLEKFSANQLDSSEMKELEEAIKKEEIFLEELDNYQDIDQYFSQDIGNQWSGKVDDQFYKSLEKYDPKVKEFSNRSILRWSGYSIAASLLLLLGFWIGKNGENPEKTPPLVSSEYQLSKELKTTEEISERIHLITNAEDQDMDKNLIETLLITLNTDESANVRIACIEVLSQYTASDLVREGLISSIKYQVSPAVISSLVDVIKKSGAQLSNKDYQSEINQDIPEPLLKSIQESIDKI